MFMGSVTCDRLDYCQCQIFSLCPACCNVVVIEELVLNCYGASCCFAVPHNQGLLLTGPPLTGITVFVFCFFNVIYAKARSLKPGRLLDKPDS